jgi:glyoxylase-like metal-dependent hydrolase (beta-lactamase superfamily II)
MINLEEDTTIAQNFKFGRYPKGFAPRPCKPDCLLKDGERIQVGEIEVNAILTRGHTEDSTCLQYASQGRRGLFTGDVVFYGGVVGYTNADGCDLRLYRTDIKKLAGLQIDYLLPGHGVFVLKNGQKHIDRAIRKLSDFVMPESFFETNEFMWDREYAATMMAGK